MLRLTFSLLLFTALLSAENKDPYAKKGPAWKTWETFSKAVIDQDVGAVKKMLSGKIAKEFPIDGIAQISREFQQNKVTFIREFDGKDKKSKYLVLSIKNKIATIVFQKNKQGLTIEDSIEQDLQDPAAKIDPNKRPLTKVKLARVKSRLKQIGTTYAMYFTDGTTSTIPTPEAVDVDSTIMTYEHPETGKEGKFLFIQPGYNYTGDSGLIIATTDKPILGNYQAVFEDGHVESITIDEFRKHSVVLGLTSKNIIYKKLKDELQKEILTLIEQLGAAKYKERKAAKSTLLSKGQGIVGFLEEKKDHSDFEVKISIAEIIDKLLSKGPTAERPKLH
jgi:hypothetical protein